MQLSPKQVDAVEKRVEFACVTNCVTDGTSGQGKLIDFNKAIRIAFVLGVRFGVASPYTANDYMGAWARENCPTDADIQEFALRYEQAMRACVWPMTMTHDDFENTEGMQE